MLSGHYPERDEDHPVHFIGHSAGAQVVHVLQQMLADKAFEGYEKTTENWVLSLTSLSGAFNGTTRAYLDGMKDDDWEDNDGVLNTISMTHPRLPIQHMCRFIQSDSECQPLLPGIWYYKIMEVDHIYFVMNRERAGVQFDLMYDAIFEHCRKHFFRKTLA